MTLAFKLRKVIKTVWLRLRTAPSGQRIVFILGCQRSGTTMLLRIFEHDWNVQTYREQSVLSRPDAPLRLLPPERIQPIFDRQSASLIVLKPLVESQHAAALLDAFPKSRVVWVFRHYRNVAFSNLKKFGERNGIDDLRPLVEEAPGNWRAEAVPSEVRATIRAYFSEEMSPWDAAVLFWYARNALFFSQALAAHPRVRLCRYCDLVTTPERHLSDLYAWLSQPFPGKQVTRLVHPGAHLEIPDFPLTPAVESLAQEMWERLLAAYVLQEQMQ
ncbi:MAG: hypothetical protein Fur0018_06730 [Anaerolineales bacterium]